MYIYIYKYICVYIYMFIYVNIYVYINTCICIYIGTWPGTNNLGRARTNLGRASGRQVHPLMKGFPDVLASDLPSDLDKSSGDIEYVQRPESTGALDCRA